MAVLETNAPADSPGSTGFQQEAAPTSLTDRLFKLGFMAAVLTATVGWLGLLSWVALALFGY